MIKRLRSLPGEGMVWGLAIRKNNGRELYKGNNGRFSYIKNSFLYWRADPFLFEYNGETYLFAELFNRIKGKGVLGAARIRGGKCGRFKVCLDLPYHLSYPCIYEKDGNIYMIPECKRSGKVTVYSCVDFPYKWKEAFTLINEPCVDTTPMISEENTLRFFTTINSSDVEPNTTLYLVDENRKAHLLVDGNCTVRSAGHIIREKDQLLRPAQDCTTNYGNGLIFKRIVSLDTGNYKEIDYKYISPNDICIDDSKINFLGIHTYNKTDKYEVIDLSYNVGISLPYLIKKAARHFKKE